MDILSTMTRDVVELVIFFLSSSPKSVLLAHSVSKQWYKIFNDYCGDLFWLDLSKRDHSLSFKFEGYTWKQFYMLPKAVIGAVCSHLNTVSIPYLMEKKKIVPFGCMEKDCKFGDNSNCAWACTKNGCNYIGCGRGNSGHAVKHYEATKHPISEKLPIPDTENIYNKPWCYVCNRFLGYSENEQKLEYVHVCRMIAAFTPEKST